jgi:hypothetical protein
MRWVHATLVYSSLAAYERFVQPLTPAEKERYHEEMNLLARFFGTPAEVLADSYGEFRDYFEAQVRSYTMTVTPPARPRSGSRRSGRGQKPRVTPGGSDRGERPWGEER